MLRIMKHIRRFTLHNSDRGQAMVETVLVLPLLLLMLSGLLEFGFALCYPSSQRKVRVRCVSAIL